MDAVQMLTGTVVLMKANVLGLHKLDASILDRAHEAAGKGVSLRLVGGRIGKPAYLQDWISTITPLNKDESEFTATFDWDEDMGIPEAFTIRNDHHSEFYLRSLTLEHFPRVGRLHFACNSWVYPAHRYDNDRVFFRNKCYLPHETPAHLVPLRAQELRALRGDGKATLREWDRVYDYDVYNDLADPSKGPKHYRPVLGGTPQHPYPRRGRTGRLPLASNPNYESRLPVADSINIYVPRDERFNHLRMSDFVGYGLKSIAQSTKSAAAGVDFTPNEFDSFDDVLDLYEEGASFLQQRMAETVKSSKAFELLKEIVRSDGEKPGKFPMPSIIKNDRSAWITDEEFARQMIAGLNPAVIKCLEEFPVKSKLDPSLFGHQDSTITREHVEPNLEGMSIGTAMEKKRMFILDYHDALMPYVRRINTTSTKVYATRTILFLKGDGTLTPVAIELSLPNPTGDQNGTVSAVHTPAHDGVEGTIWQLAKAYVAVNDSGYHQLISHWLHTHAAVEPFVIATHRQLSVLHPIHKLLHPHFRDTMNINALGRQLLINAGGLLEFTVFPSRFALELSSELYKTWKFTEQALPKELKNRGMAVDDSQSKSGVRLVIEDYPYAVDGLEIWCAIRQWVEDYCGLYYRTDQMVRDDVELALWWKEIREVGHGDKSEEEWWPKMETRGELIESCTTLIWMSSALHAAVNFGQYPYGGFLPNRPSMSRRLMPEKGSPEYEEMKADPEKAFLKTITAQFQTLVGISLIEVLSRHAADEVYLGQRESAEWTIDREALDAFQRFGKRLEDIEHKIAKMNQDPVFKNRNGPARMPYTLLIPTSTSGLTGRGIPNSISI